MKNTILFRKKFMRSIGFFMAMVMITTSIYVSEIFVNAEGNSVKKDYIVLIQNIEDVSERIDELDAKAIVERDSSISENSYFVAELSEHEAAVLAQEEGILVEKDFVLEANSVRENSRRQRAFYRNSVESDSYEANRSKKERDHERKKLFYRDLLEKKKAEKKDNSEEWNVQAINADDITVDPAGNQKVKVAVLDSGVDFVTGINLAGSINLVKEEDYATVMFQDLTGHGTNIASVIAGNEENVAQGVNSNVELYSVKVLDENNSSPVSRIVEGIYWCINNNIDIINMSFGTSVYSKALHIAVEDAYRANILMVGAAGNNAGDVEYPAAFEEVMAVAATNIKSEIADFSNTGEELDVAAPGEKIRVTGFFGLDGVTHGTSIAVPQVVGVASLLWEKDLSKSNEFIRQLISYSAKNISGTDECGLLDAKYALASYDVFADDFSQDNEVSIDVYPGNEDPVDTFEYISEDEAYVEGRWGGHAELAENGLIANKVIDQTILAILKKGAVYPDRADSQMNPDAPEYHGGYTWEDIEVNYIACFEYLTEIALNGGKSSGIPRSYIAGLGSLSYEFIKPDFDATWVGGRTWADVLSGIKVNNVSVANNATNRKYFTWGIAIHVLGDIFAHGTYRKSDGKQIVHSNTPTSSQISGADQRDVVKGRWKAAELAIRRAVDCMIYDVYGCYCEIDYALKNQTYTNNADLFLKKKFLKYAKSNAGGELMSAESKRFTAANID